jgi:AGCS family alanine or glycine:cation symporter
MAIVYMVGALIIILNNASAVPDAFMQIFSDAFTGTAATGGFVGSVFMLAIQQGVSRGVFSNEAGLGSAPIAHAAAKTNDPVRQGMIGMLGTFIDTIVICTMTALVIIITQGWLQVDAETGKQLSRELITSQSFSTGLPGFGEYIVTFGLAFFAFTTILGWSFYGERCAEYLLGVKVIPFYRILWITVVFVGAIAELKPIWNFADAMNGLMIIPNLIALLLLSPIIFKITQSHFEKNR